MKRTFSPDPQGDGFDLGAYFSQPEQQDQPTQSGAGLDVDTILSELPEEKRKVLKDSLMMHSDYTKKTMELAEQKKLAKQAAEEGIGNVQAVMERLKKMEGSISKDDVLSIMTEMQKGFDSKLASYGDRINQHDSLIQQREMAIATQEAMNEISAFQNKYPELPDDVVRSVELVAAASIEKGNDVKMEDVYLQMYPEEIRNQLKRQNAQNSAMLSDRKTSAGSSNSAPMQSIKGLDDVAAIKKSAVRSLLQNRD